MPDLPQRAKILEVGPRDGLQNEREQIPTEVKLEFIEALATAGLRHIEMTSFVHPKAVPQLADAADLLDELPRLPTVTGSALVPNEKGLERALATPIEVLPRIAVFTAASESFTKHNIRMTIDESLEVFGRVISQAREAGRTVRGYVSTAFACPYEGPIDPAAVVEVCRKLLELGVDELGVSDTIGTAVPRDVHRVLTALFDAGIPTDAVALHLHDTCGAALANVHEGLRMGVWKFDSAAGGLGGCPYAPGAAGNLATEDLVYFLEEMGVMTGVVLQGVFEASRIIAEELGRPLPGKQYQRLAAACGA